MDGERGNGEGWREEIHWVNQLIILRGGWERERERLCEVR